MGTMRTQPLTKRRYGASSSLRWDHTQPVGLGRPAILQAPLPGPEGKLSLIHIFMWLLPLTEYIPLAALAAVLVMVAYDMSDLRTVRHIFQGPKSDWSVMILTFALTVIFDLTVAVYTGVMLASLLFMRRMSELTGIHTCVSGEEEEAAAHDIPLPDEETVPDGVELFALTGPLFFGVADRFQSTLDAMETPPKVFIMYLHNTPAIDMTGIHALEAVSYTHLDVDKRHLGSHAKGPLAPARS